MEAALLIVTILCLLWIAFQACIAVDESANRERELIEMVKSMIDQISKFDSQNHKDDQH